MAAQASACRRRGQAGRITLHPAIELIFSTRRRDDAKVYGKIAAHPQDGHCRAGSGLLPLDFFAPSR
jgi:hypothetical protein